MRVPVEYTRHSSSGRYFFIAGLVWLICNSVLVQAKTLRVAVPDYPPYTYVHNEQIVGEGFESFVAIMKQLGVEYQAQPVPHFGRSIIEMENNQLDALLLATESQERNALAVYSAPLFYTDWAWVWLAERTDINPNYEQFKHTAQVSAQMNSNIYHWLSRQHYKITPGTSDIRGLFSLLDHKRVDAVMLPALTARTLISQEQLPKTHYNIHKQIKLPYDIYVSKTYLAANPGFMERLNKAISEYHAQKAAASTQQLPY